MGSLIFIGLGLYDELDISLRGLEEARGADKIYLELYTSLMPGLSIEGLERLLNKRVFVVGREGLEEGFREAILREAMVSKVALLIPGDPYIATTHVALRLQAEGLGIKTRVVHNSSIFSAAPSLTGLSCYKFGRSVTVTYPEGGVVDEAPYDVVKENRGRGLHTLTFLDLRVEEGRFMSINEGLKILSFIEGRRKEGVLARKTLVVGVARAGSLTPIVRGGYVEDLMKFNFGPPPHIMIFPGRLHFIEAEALVKLAGAPAKVLEGAG